VTHASSALGSVGIIRDPAQQTIIPALGSMGSAGDLDPSIAMDPLAAVVVFGVDWDRYRVDGDWPKAKPLGRQEPTLDANGDVARI
jgi:hypothetical protein